MNSPLSDNARRFFRDTYQPFTNALLAASIALFLSYYLYRPLYSALDAMVPQAWAQPWRILLYPILPGSIIGLIFNGLLLYMVGGSLERGWGTKTIAIFYLAVSILTALAFTLISLLFQGPISVPGGLVLAALLVAFCTINPDETINLYGLIPIKTRYIAAGVCLIIFFSMGWNNPLVGLMALVGCGFAVLWVKQDWAYQIGRGNFPVTMSIPKSPRAPKLRLIDNKPRPRDDRFTPRDLSPLKWLARRNERKKFEKLMRDD